MWSYLFNPDKDQVSKKEEIVKKETSKEIQEPPQAKVLTHSESSEIPETLTGKTVTGIDEKEIQIDTPLYKAVFTNVGPTIKSFKLKKYFKTTDPDSPMIELVSLEKNMGDFLLINFEGYSIGQNEKITYQVDSTTVRLGPESSPKDLIFISETSDGLSMKQTFRFFPDQYKIELNLDVVNKSGKTVNGTFKADLKALPPQEKASYYSYVGLALLLDDDLKEVEIEDTSEEEILRGQIDWVAYEDDFFISAVIPENKSKGTFEGRLLKSGLLHGTYLPPSVSLVPSQQTSFQYTLFFGPRDLSILKQCGGNIDRAINFGWTDIIARPLLYTLRFFYKYVHNYGVAIILLTILVKILFWPLTHKSYKSMKEMQKLQPIMAKMREKYKNDKQKLNKEMMGLYKTYKVNPMGGCLPMVVQLPVFFALFRVLGSAIELRHAPFMLWINDLSAPDRLFNFPFTIPFMAPPFGIPILTLLMGASMFLQQKMTPTPGDPTQAKIMMFLPVIFTFMFINFPSGLVLYWLVNNILSIGQQYRIYKKPA